MFQVQGNFGYPSDPAGNSTPEKKPMRAEGDLPRPGDDGVGEAICVTRQHGRAADVGCSVHLRLSDPNGGKDWKTESGTSE